MDSPQKPNPKASISDSSNSQPREILTKAARSSPERPPGKTNLLIGGSSSSTESRSDNNSTINNSRGWGASPNQAGHASVASDILGDRVFPIRSVVKVDTSTHLAIKDDPLPQSSDTDAPGLRIPVHVLGHPRAESTSDLKRMFSGSVSSVASPHAPSDHVTTFDRKRALSGPYSSVQADAVRKGRTVPLNLNLQSSDDGESVVIGSSVALSDSHSASQPSDVHFSGDHAHISTRFSHTVTEDGHIIIKGRDETLQQCEDEPIHIPGAIQGFGALIAMHEESDGRFVVRYVSENSEKILGYSPRQLFLLNNFLDILKEEQQDNLLDHIDFIRDEDADPALNGPEVFSLYVRPRKSREYSKLWCAIHINAAHPDLIICEFEKDDDQVFPLHPSDDLTPENPFDGLHGNPTLEEIEESTEVLSKPLRVLRSARKKRGEQGAMQVFDIMSQVQEQLSSATSLPTFLKVLVGIVKELTGFHRVMVYQFDSSFNGKVVAELVDTTRTVDLYHGLHFPASDIPRQARELYKLNKVRLLYDRELESARIVCRSKEDLELPLDMSHAYLRAMSPVHLKYLGNMGVRASMSISINAFNELWGLVACHSYGPHGMRVSFPIRKMSRLVGDTASRSIERLSYASRLQARKLINTAPADGNPAGYIIASSEDLLKLFDADFGLLSIKGQTQILGVVEQSQEALAMLEYLRMRKLTSVVASQDIREDFPDLQYALGFQVIAGLLYVPLSVGGNDFIVFFRRGQVKQVKWAGNPYEKSIRQGTAGYLEPRTSFKIWNETVVGKCREWVEEEVETAAVLCLVYGKFIEVWRQKEAALQSSKLTRILLANSAHEVRTPLNAIINYLEIALEGPLDQETRDNLSKSHSASKSLIYVINDLLDLTKTEEGQRLVKLETFDLPICIREATDPFRVDAERKGIDYQVHLHPGLPGFVYGDGRRIRQAIANITANAIANTSIGYVRVDMYVSEIREQAAVVEIVVTDSGAGMNPRQLDALFRELEQVDTEELDRSPSPDHESQEMRTLGLGLAIVARIVRNMDGQLRLKSLEGLGSRVVIQLPFQLLEASSETPRRGDGEGRTTPAVAVLDESTVSAIHSPKDAPDGYVLLFDACGISINMDERGVFRRKSLGSLDDPKSEAERLIDAIQTPLPLDKRNKDDLTARERSPASNAAVETKLDQEQAGNQDSESAARHLPKEADSEAVPGTAKIRHSKTPVHAIKVPDEFVEMPVPAEPEIAMPVPVELGEPGRVETDLSVQWSKSSQSAGQSAASASNHDLRILVAEDDPINLKIMKKRLERAGHEVHHAVNGQDCAILYQQKSPMFDAILMDIQMPIVDGMASARMIREVEKSSDHAGFSPLAAACGRIPIFAVSASLVEQERETYVETGFDGWILKPIDFKRLGKLLEGIQSHETRHECLYNPGGWELGGWFPSNMKPS